MKINDRKLQLTLSANPAGEVTEPVCAQASTILSACHLSLLTALVSGSTCFFSLLELIVNIFHYYSFCENYS